VGEGVVKMPDLTEFSGGRDTLRIYRRDELIFSSQKDGLEPFLDYIAASPTAAEVTVLDRVTGNAAALLAILARAVTVYGLVGSRYAARTLEDHGVDYHFGVTVPSIQRADGAGICPMEQLSLGKTPAEFYAAVRRD
jgi:hypothetical protein